jgi:hypothetical protein
LLLPRAVIPADISSDDLAESTLSVEDSDGAFSGSAVNLRWGQVTVRTVDTGANQRKFIVYNGMDIAEMQRVESMWANGLGGRPFRVEFNENASRDGVESLLRSLNYTVSSAVTAPQQRRILVTLRDTLGQSVVTRVTAEIQ